MTRHKTEAYDTICNEDLESNLDLIRQAILQLSPKQQHLFCAWMKERCNYLCYEKSFCSEDFPYLSRGQIVYANLGYNIGNERGGKRPVIVINNYHSNRSGAVVIIPISTIEPSQNPECLPDYKVYLGEVYPGSGKLSYAAITSIREISKMRIDNPLGKARYILKDSDLDRIDKMIIKYFTKPVDKS